MKVWQNKQEINWVSAVVREINNNPEEWRNYVRERNRHIILLNKTIYGELLKEDELNELRNYHDNIVIYIYPARGVIKLILKRYEKWYQAVDTRARNSYSLNTEINF